MSPPRFVASHVRALALAHRDWNEILNSVALRRAERKSPEESASARKQTPENEFSPAECRLNADLRETFALGGIQ